MRCWLKERILLIRRSGIRDVIIPDWEKALEQFMTQRPHLSPRAQRDWPRLLCLIKGFALLNCFERVKAGDHSISADPADVDAAFKLYEMIAKPNELGLSPETYRIYEEVILPLTERGAGVTRKVIAQRYFEVYRRPLADDRLRRQILPALESTGLVSQGTNPDDKRETLVYCTVASPISTSPENRGKNSAALQERIEAGLQWLRQSENLDDQSWASVDKLSQVVGGFETVQLMIRDGLIELHPVDSNLVRPTRR
jgi:hypothetical protein